MSENLGGVKLIRAKEVAERLGVKEVTVWRWSKAGKIGTPIKLSARVTAWKESDVNAFIEARACA